MPRLSIELHDIVDSLVQVHGFKIQSEQYDEAQFGNAKLELSSADMQVQFIRDRGQTFINVKRDNGEWIQLETVLAHLQIDESVGFEASDAGGALLRHLPEIRRALLNDYDAISDLHKKKRAELIDRFRK